MGLPSDPVKIVVQPPVPENKNAPCNICGRGWPYHHDACAYKQTAIERKRLQEIVDELLHMLDGAGMKALVRKYRKRIKIGKQP